MTKNLLPLITGLVFMPIAAMAQPPAAGSLLSGSIQAMRAAGYTGLEDIQVPSAPAAAAAASTLPAQTDDALANLISASQAAPESSGFIIELARALGFEFVGDSFLNRPLPKQSDQDGVRFFSTVVYRGNTEIIVEIGSKATKEIRSYRASSAGVLEAAAVTTKSNGQIHATAIALPNAEASAGFAAQLAFWTQYSRDHLKH